MRTSEAPSRRRRTLIALLAATAFVGGGCSGSDGHVGSDVGATGAPGTVAAVEQLSGVAAHRWGYGRALGAATSSSGSLAVVTTIGVEAVSQQGAVPAALEEFSTPLQVGPVALSPDGATFAIATNPAGVRLYDLPTGKPVAAYALPADAEVRAVEYARTGGLVVDTTLGPFVSADSNTPPEPVIDAPSGKTAVLADGTLVTPVTGTNQLVIARPGGTEKRSLTLGGGATVIDAQASPDGSLIAVSAGVGQNMFERQDQVVVLDATTFEQRAAIDTGVALDPLEWAVTDAAVAVANGSALTAWTLDGTTTDVAPATDSKIAQVTAVPNGLLTIHTDGTLVRWSPTATSPAMFGHPGITLQSAVIDADGRTVTTVDYYGTITAWDIADGETTASDDHFGSGAATDVAISPDGTRVGVATSAGRVVVLDASLGEQTTFTTGTAPEVVGAVSFDRSGTSLATGLAERRSPTAFDDSVALWNLADTSRRFHLDGKAQDVDGCSFFYARIRFSPDGTQMAVTSHDFHVQVLDATSGAVRADLPGTTTVLDIGYTLDGTKLVATYDDGTVNVWRTSDYSLATTYRAASGGQQAIALMPDSTTMVTTDITGSITLLDIMTGTQLRTFDDARFRTATLALSGDGALLAAPMADGSIGIWSTASGHQLATLAGHTEPATALAFSPDGTWLASSSSDGTVRTWALTRG